jgi:nucleoside-diphosphate-sugar epimerase
LEDAAALRPELREAYHFAAIYDLAVSRALGMKVNVEGTAHVLDFLATCPNFDRLHYVSTCYVSGRHPGRFTERDLSLGQRFNNDYEETKYLAEVEVQNRMKQGLAATIYRPAIVVGDSTTGATQKYDGPYFALQWVLRCRKVAPMVTVGNGRAQLNVVPRDFIVNALAHLSELEASRGQVYQLCNPNPPTVTELYEIFSRVTGRKILRLRVPTALAKGSLKYLPGVNRVLRILPETVDYFTHPTTYTCDNTLRDLAGTGIACPNFADYAAVLVRFMREHPEIGSRGLQ